MITKYNKLIAFSLIIFILVNCLWVTVYAAEDSMSGFEKAAESLKLVLYSNMSDGQIAIKDKSSGHIWYSNPPDRDKDKLAKGINKMQLSSQLLVTFMGEDGQTFIINSQVGCINKKGLNAEKTAEGIKFIYDFPRDTEKFKIPVLYTLENDYLKAEIDAAGIIEYGDMKVMSVSLLPFFGAGGISDTGYIMVPDGSGALINFNNGKESYRQYSEYIYGRDSVFTKTFQIGVKQTIHLPVFGIRKGDYGFLAVVNKGDFLGRIDASVSRNGTSYNNVFCTFKYREMDTAVLAEANWSSKDVTLIAENHNNVDKYEVRYYFLDDNDADYSGMARRYRKFLMEEKGLKKVTRKDEIPFYMELYGGIKKEKSILGIPLNILLPLTTYKESTDIIKELKKYGINNIVLKYSGWMKGGANDKVPAKVTTERKLGGEGDFRKLAQFAEKNGVELYPDVEFLNIYKNGNGFYKFFFAARTVSRAPATQFVYRTSTYVKNILMPFWYLLSPLELNKAVERFIKSYERFDLPRISIGSLGNQIYSDFKKNRVIDRAESGQIWQKEMELLKSKVGSLMIDNANAYAFPHARHIVNAPGYSSRFDIEDEEIPFYQMTIHGIIPYSISPVNLSSDVGRHMLKTAEVGSYPYYSWIAGESSELKETNFDYLYSANYKLWVEKAVNDYKQFNTDFAEVLDREIMQHKKLDDGVYETMYEGKTKVIVNYNKENYKYDGKTVKGKSYLVIDGGK